MKDAYRNKTTEYLQSCVLCPRVCGADRLSGATGFCGVPADVYIARAALHMWEEPCISGVEGSGTVFFAGCNLRCVFCQNYEVAHARRGHRVSVDELADIFLSLQNQGANNINLVTPTAYTPQICLAVTIARERGLTLPIVYNCGGYERVETLRMLENIVDIYLTDFKYMDSSLASDFSAAPNYPAVAKAALEEMVRQQPKPIFDDRGMIQKGVIVRQLLLPGHVRDAQNIIEYLYTTYGKQIYVSMMGQYTPFGEVREANQNYVEKGRDGLQGTRDSLHRKVTKREYKRYLQTAMDLGIEQAYFQEGDVAEESFIPDFEGSGYVPERSASFSIPANGRGDVPERRISFSVLPEEDGCTVEQAVLAHTPLSKRQLKRFKFRENGILVNGSQRRTTDRVSSGDVISLRLADGTEKQYDTKTEDVKSMPGIGVETESKTNGADKKMRTKWLPPTGCAADGTYPLRILYEDEDLIVVEKASGLVCHPSPGHYRDTLANQVAAYLGDVDMHIVGRLDRDTSGCVLFAKNRESAGILARQRTAKQLEKIYFAEARGVFADDEQQGEVDAELAPVPGELMKMQIVPDGQGKKAKTFYRVLERKNNSTVLRVQIQNGRTHQIRVHMASLGHPLVGDVLYGLTNETSEQGSLRLHAGILRLVQPFTGEPIVVRASQPEWHPGAWASIIDEG